MSKISVTEERKRQKRNQILQTIRSKGDVSRFDVKKKTKLSMSTVLTFIERLLEEGLLYEEESDKTGVGRKPTWLRINPDGRYFLGVDFNKDNIYISILNFSLQEIYHREESCAGITAKQFLDTLFAGINQAIAFLGDDAKKLTGIGIGAPGYLDKKNGKILSYAHMPELKEVELQKQIQERFSLPVMLENNVNAMAVEAASQRKQSEDCLFVSVRSGIRMSLYLKGELYLGCNDFAGEIGHTPVAGSHRECPCGRKGCLDTEASNIGILSRIHEGIAEGRFKEFSRKVAGKVENLRIEDFIANVRKGNPESIQLAEKAALFLGETVSMAVNLLNPTAVIVSGKLVDCGKAYTETLKNKIWESTVADCGVQIKTQRPDETAGARGMARLVYLSEFKA